MPDVVTRINAVKRFFEQNTNRPVTTTEFMEFWKNCNEQERQEFAVSAAQQMGLVLSTN